MKNIILFCVWLTLLKRILSNLAKNCNQLVTNLPDYCFTCAEGFYSLQESAFPGQPFLTKDCIPKINEVLELELYVSEKECSNSSPCNGSKVDPFDNLINAFELTNKESRKYIKALVKIYLLGNEIFILQVDLQKAAKYYFRRSQLSLEISPFFCSTERIPGCKEDFETVIVNFKTNEILLFLNSNFTMKNILIIGSDMPLEHNYGASSSPTCYGEKKSCCIKEINMQTFPGIYSDCDPETYRSFIPLKKESFFGFLTFEISTSVNFVASIRNYPQVIIENCTIKEVSTVFPTDVPRFSCFIQIMNDFVSLAINNLTLLESSFEDGLIKQINMGNSFDQGNTYTITPSLSISNLLVINFKLIYDNEQTKHYILYFEKIWGTFEVKSACVRNTLNANVTFLYKENPSANTSIEDVCIRDNNGVKFLHCKNCGTITIAKLIFMNSYLWLLEDAYSIVLKGSEDVLLSQLSFNEFSINDFSKKSSFALEISNIKNKLIFFDIHLENSVSPALRLDSSFLRCKKLIATNLSTYDPLLTSKNSSVTLEEVLMAYVKILPDFLISMESEKRGSNYYFALSEGHISNFVFFNDATDNGVIQWPIFTQSDALLIKNVSIFNIKHTDFDGYVNFFLAYSFSRVEFENIDFSYNYEGLNTLLYLFDTFEIVLRNISFRYNQWVDYYLIHVFCYDCQVYFSNLIILTAKFSQGCFFFSGQKTGIFENFTFTNISAILPSYWKLAYSFIYGLNFFWNQIDCYLSNWNFLSSEYYNFTPSNFFYFDYNYNIVIFNISLLNTEATTDYSQTHILAAILNYKILIEEVYAKNFFCQQSYLGNTLYDGGIISIFNSPTFIREDNYPTSIKIINVAIVNCKFCKNGAIGIVNIREISLENISLVQSENINGGGLSIFYGVVIIIENLSSQATSAKICGGVFFLSGPTCLIIKNTIVYDAHAPLGGVFFIRKVSNLTIQNFHIINSWALFDGGVICSIDSNITIVNGLAVDYLASREGGFTYIRRGTLFLSKGLEGIGGLAEKGGFIFALDANEIKIEDISVRNTSAEAQGVCFYLEDAIKFQAKNITLRDIISDSGLGNIYLSLRSKAILYEFQDFLCYRINLISSVLVYLENEQTYKSNLLVTFENILIYESFGSVAFFKCFYFNINHNFILRNVTVLNFNWNSKESARSSDKNLFSFNSICCQIRNFVFKNISFESDFLTFSQANIVIQHLFFQATYDSNFHSKTRYFINLLNAYGSLSNIFFLGDKTTGTVILLSEKSKLSLEGGLICKCHSIIASCLELYETVLRVSFFSFSENQGLDHGLLNSVESSLSIMGSIFHGNSAIETEQVFTGIIVNNIAIYGNYLNQPMLIKDSVFFDNYPGVSLLVISLTLDLSHCFFFAQQAKLNVNKALKAIWCKNSNLAINDSSFFNFRSKKGGTIRVENSQEGKYFYLKSSYILNSSSDYGGALSAFGLLEIFLSENLFTNNKAFKNENGDYGNFGVGVFIASGFNSRQSFYLLNNQFFNNSAENIIAVVFANFLIKTASSDTAIDTNHYFNNIDETNSRLNLVYLPFKIKFYLKNSGLTQVQIDATDVINFLSGVSIDLGFALHDYNDQSYIFDHQSHAFLEIIDKGLIPFMMTNTYINSEKGEFLFRNLLINTVPNKNFKLNLIVNINSDYIYQEDKNYFRVDPLRLNFFSMPCETGDIFIEGDSSCLKCPPGKYSLSNPMIQSNASDLRCLDCPANAFCPGGFKIIPLNGYWRFSNISLIILECLSKASCLGKANGQLSEEELIHGKCLENSYGPLCYLCEPGFGRFSKTGVCRRCSAEFESYLKLSLIILAFLIYSLIQIKLNFKSIKRSSSEILLKIIVTHFQQLSLITLIDIGWKPELKALFTLQETFRFISEDLFPLDCLLQKLEFNIYIQKVVATNIYPVFLLMLASGCWIIFLLISSYKSPLLKIKIRQTVQVTFIIVIVLLFPEIISKCMSLFTCLRVDNTSAVTLLLYSPDVICWSQEHANYLLYAAVPGILVWGAISPLVMAYFLLVNRNLIKEIINEENLRGEATIIISSIREPNHKLEKIVQIKFLFKGYKSDYFYWELFVFVKKFFLITIGCFSDLLPANLRGLLLLVVISFYLLIQVRCNPFDSSYLNRLEFLSLLTNFVTAYVGIILNSRDFLNFAIFLLIIALLINIVFFLYWLKLFLKEYVRESSFLKFIATIITKRKTRVTPSKKLIFK